MTERKPVTISLRDAQERYGLPRPTLTRIGKANNAIIFVGNKYLLFVDRMDKVIRDMA